MNRIKNNLGARGIRTGLTKRAIFWAVVVIAMLWFHAASVAQMGTPTPLPPKEREKAEAEKKESAVLSNYPKLVNITASTGIHFDHRSSPEAKFIAESMSGGVALID